MEGRARKEAKTYHKMVNLKMENQNRDTQHKNANNLKQRPKKLGNFECEGTLYRVPVLESQLQYGRLRFSHFLHRNSLP